jgi:hypothetical protein
MLVYNFNPKALLEVKTPKSSKYMKTCPDVFRSYGGMRRVDGKPFKGAVYYYQSNEILPNSREISPTVDGWQRKGLRIEIVKPGKWANIKIATSVDKWGRPVVKIERMD